ncbi:hypothetical protein F4703DRAFT_1899709 [Phycomyces blakesleeanus]
MAEQDLQLEFIEDLEISSENDEPEKDENTTDDYMEKWKKLSGSHKNSEKERSLRSLKKILGKNPTESEKDEEEEDKEEEEEEEYIFDREAYRLNNALFYGEITEKDSKHIDMTQPFESADDIELHPPLGILESVNRLTNLYLSAERQPKHVNRFDISALMCLGSLVEEYTKHITTSLDAKISAVNKDTNPDENNDLTKDAFESVDNEPEQSKQANVEHSIKSETDQAEDIIVNHQKSDNSRKRTKKSSRNDRTKKKLKGVKIDVSDSPKVKKHKSK